MNLDVLTGLFPPQVLWLFLIVGTLGVLVELLRPLSRGKSRRAFRQIRGGRDSRPAEERRPWAATHGGKRPLDAADQLRIVMEADFKVQPLLNRSEARLFKELDRAVLGRNPTWQVMAQVSLGEILSTRDPRAYSCINSKRVDLLLVDEECRPRHAVEYQGGGHYQGSAAARDAVKKEALRRAGIGYHEIVAGGTTPADLRRLVDKLVDIPAPQSGVAP